MRRIPWLGVAATLAVAWTFVLPLPLFAASATTRVSLNSAGHEGNGPSGAPAVSADGRFVAFTSQATNLVPDDVDSTSDLFLHDRQTGITVRLAERCSGVPSIAADGRYVAFTSWGSDLVPNDTNNSPDTFVIDRVSGEIECLSIGASGAQLNQGSWTSGPSISADGRYVSFNSSASNLVLDDTNNADDVFVRDRFTGVTSRVSISSSGVQGWGNSWYSSISDDGRFVAFNSDAELASADGNHSTDVYVHDRISGTTTRISEYGRWPAISANGQCVAFMYGNSEARVYERLTGDIQTVSVDSHGNPADSVCEPPLISADGRYLVYTSYASNLVSGDTNGTWDVFVHDRQSAETRLVSVDSAGTQGNQESHLGASIADDGSCVAFASLASNLVNGDANNAYDVFVRNLQSPEPGTAENPWSEVRRPETTPTKPLIVLIGGIGEDYGFDGYQTSDSAWHDVYSYLSERGYDVVVIPSAKNATSKNVVDSLGGYTGENAARVQRFLAEERLGSRQVIVIGHSMGGLIARKWIGSSELWDGTGLKPVGLIQLGTPNAGSPLPVMSAFLNGCWTGWTSWRVAGPNQSLVDLDGTGDMPSFFNDQYPDPGVPVLKIGGNFFFNAASDEIESALFPMLRLTAFNALAAAFNLRPNDGAVSLDSLEGLPVANKTVTYPTMHSDNWMLSDYKSAGFVRPMRDTADELRILQDIYGFCEDVRYSRVKAPAAARSTPAMGPAAPRLQGSTTQALSNPEEGGSQTVLDRSVSLTAGVTSGIAFSIEGTVAAVTVVCDDPALNISVRQVGGSQVEGEHATSGSVHRFAYGAVPGAEYEVQLRSTTTAHATVTVLDSGPSTLLVEADSSVPAGNEAVVKARLLTNGEAAHGQFYLSLDGGPRIQMHDDGVSPDASSTDGEYTGRVLVPSSGVVSVSQVDATATVAGATVERTGVAITQIAEPRASMSGSPVLSSSPVPSGKVGSLSTAVPVHASEDCTLQVTVRLLADGNTIGRTTRTVELAAGTASVVASVAARDIAGLGDTPSSVTAEVDVYDSTDGGLVRLDGGSSNSISVGRVDLALASVTVDAFSASVKDDPVLIRGAASCSTETIAGVGLSLDGGATWFAAPAPPGGWGANETAWSCAFTLEEGEWTVSTRLGGQSGVIKTDDGQYTFRVDRTAPKTTAHIDGDMTTKAHVAFTAEDSSTVSSTRYSLDGTAWQEGDSLDCAEPGVHGLRFFSTDVAGNVEGEKSVIFTVVAPVVPDTAAPTTSSDARATYTSSAVITLTAQDTGGSGLAATYYRLDGAAALAGDTVTTSIIGRHSLTFWSVDKAGNIEAAQSVTFEVVAPDAVPAPKSNVSLGAPIAPKTMRKNKYYTVYGSLAPSHSQGSRPVWIYKYKKVSGKWKSYGFVEATAYEYNGYTRYKAKMRLTSKGAWRLKARSPEDALHLDTWSSKYDSVTVK